jgi:putative methyltransferase (TIGR04325 family)
MLSLTDGNSQKMKLPKFYSSYKDALAECYDSGYASEELARLVVEKNKSYREKLAANPTIDTNSSRIMRAFSMYRCSNALNVLDFGGGAGNHHAIAKLLLPNIVNLRWAIVETEVMVRYASSIAEDGLTFHENYIKAAEDLGKVDLLVLSSSLQYCEYPLRTLDSLLKLRPHRVFITRTPLSHQGNRHVVLQESNLADNGPGPIPGGFEDRIVTYPCVFETVVGVEELISSSGYLVKYRLVEESSFHGKDGPLFAFEYLCEPV